MKRTIFLTLTACMLFTIAKSFTEREQHPNGYDTAQTTEDCTRAGVATNTEACDTLPPIQ